MTRVSQRQHGGWGAFWVMGKSMDEGCCNDRGERGRWEIYGRIYVVEGAMVNRARRDSDRAVILTGSRVVYVPV